MPPPTLTKKKNNALLVILQTDNRLKDFLQESSREMLELSQAALLAVCGEISGHINSPSPSHFVREGKLQEIRDKARASGANLLVFNVDLTPVQARNIESLSKLPCLDRTGLILEIFGRRADSNAGKLQVELARLNYILPRLGGLGKVLSRLGGGIGTRGPGESELETDRRKVRLRIQRVKEELEKVRKHRDLLRAGRKKRNFFTCGLVGYTNAGKSTLLNALTKSNAVARNQMFSTLDPKIRAQSLGGSGNILFIDTVGFLRDLPHALIKAFHATLEEVEEADMLIHVLDASNPKAPEFNEAVQKVLEEIGVSGKPVLLALNKADKLSELEQQRVLAHWPEGILISASQGLGLRGLMTKVQSFKDRIRPREAAPFHEEEES